MREIKFRRWNKDKKVMEYEIECYTEVGYDNEKVEFGFFNLNDYFDDEYLMQYTGLKDKHGKEIYEGDIINFTIENFMKGHLFINVLNGIIYWNIDLATWQIMVKSQAYENFFLGDSWMREIIGNIYENPELLDEKNEV